MVAVGVGVILGRGDRLRHHEHDGQQNGDERGTERGARAGGIGAVVGALLYLALGFLAVGAPASGSGVG